MDLKRLSKPLAFRVLGFGPLIMARLKKIARSGSLTILNLHRVAPDDGSAYRPLDPSLFRYLISFVRRHFSLITFQEIECHESDKPAMILSFDDGYMDFVDYAAPILDKFGIKVNMNLIPACLESRRPPFNVIVQDFVGRHGLTKRLRAMVREVAGVEPSDNPTALSRALKERPMAEQERIARMILPELLATDGFEPTPMMGLAEARKIASVHEIGCHSFSHATMTCETDEYFRQDVAACLRYFEHNLGTRPNIYAFPNGQARHTQIEICRSYGFHHVLLVGNKFSSPHTGVHYRFNFDARSRAEARFRACGGLAPIPSRPVRLGS